MDNAIIKEKVLYTINGREYEEAERSADSKLHSDETLVKIRKVNGCLNFEDYNEHAILDDKGNVKLLSNDYSYLWEIMKGRTSLREFLLEEIEYFYRHVTGHKDFDENLPTDKAIVELYNALKDPKNTLSQFEHCIYTGGRMSAVNVNILKWLGEAIANMLFRERE